MKRTRTFLICALLAVFSVLHLNAQTMISHQGLVTTPDGTPISDGTFTLTFRLYDAEAGGNTLWTETQDNVEVTNGLFSVQLGRIEPLTDLPFDQPYFLSIATGDDTVTELTPRLPLTATPYALHAERLAESALEAGDNVTITREGNVLRITAVGDETGGDITAVNAGDGLTGGSETGDATLALDTGFADERYVNEGQEAAISGQMIADGALEAGDNVTITREGNALRITAAGDDTGGDITSVNAGDGLTGGSDTGDATLALDTNFSDTRYVNEGQANGVTTEMLVDGAVTLPKIDASAGSQAEVLTVDDGEATWQSIPSPPPGNALNAADGNPVDAVFVDNEGRVGIGRTNTHSGTAMSVNGPISFSNRSLNETFDNPLLYMFESGTNNPTRFLMAHSPRFKNWGIAYNDTSDTVLFIGNDIIGLSVQLGSQMRVGIRNPQPQHPLHIGTPTSPNDNNPPNDGNGAHVTTGGVWTNGSSRTFKEGFQPVDTAAILKQVADLPLSRWRYRNDTQGGDHIGPVAEDFYAAFGLGGNERYIGTVDADGVALAAIQGLLGRMEGLEATIRRQEAENQDLRARLERLEASLQTLTR